MSRRTNRHRRHKVRERIDLPPPLEVRDRRDRDIALFAEPDDPRADLRLVRRAIREGWKVPEKMRHWLVPAVFEIAMREGTNGISESDVDCNSMAACMTMIAMHGANIRQYQAETRRLLAEQESVSHSGRK
jgi:hypothetical protein